MLSLLLSFQLWAHAQQEVTPEQNLKQTSICDVRPDTGTLTVEMNVAVWMFYGKPAAYFMPERELCLKSGQMHKVQYFETKEIIGEVEIVKLLRTTLNRLTLDLSNVKDQNARKLLSENLGQIEPLTKLSYPDLKPDDPIVVAVIGRVKKGAKFINPFTRLVPSLHMFAAPVEFDQVTRLLAKENPVIFDTRKAEHFRWWSLPGAVRVDFPRSELRAQPLELERFEAMFGRVPREKLPKNKDAPILILGHSAIDWTSYHLVFGFRMAGYKNLYWYRGGQEDWHQIRRILPDEKELGVKVMTGEEVQTKMKDAILIDWRAASYHQELHVPGALPVSLNAPLQGPPRHNHEIEDQTFLKRNFPWDMSQLGNDRSKLIIVMGHDQADWMPVYSAMVAKAAGFTNVYWFKGGFAEWRSLNRWFGPERFRMDGTVSRLPPLPAGPKKAK